MNNIINSDKYLNFFSQSSNETKNNKFISIKDFNYNKISLIHLKKVLDEKLSFSLAKYNTSNNNPTIFPINKIILKRDTNPLMELEHRNNNQNKDILNHNNKKYKQFNISLGNQISPYNNIAFNKDTNNFSNNGINLIKYLKFRNLISRNANDLYKPFFFTRDHMKLSESNDNRYDIILKQKNYKNLNDYLIVNNLKYLESESKNIYKSKSQVENIPNKIILPKMNVNSKKSIPKINKKNPLINEVLTEKNNKMNTIFPQKIKNGINIPKIIFNKGKSIIKHLKKIKAIKNEIKLTIEALSVPGTNYNSNKLNQDTYFIFPDIKYTNNLNENNFIQIFGIFDGHGEYGDIISKEIKEYFLQYFNKLNLKNEKIYENLCNNNYEEIFNLFSEINNKLHAKYSKENICNNSGSTANIVILFKEKILSINLGHSKSIIIYKDDKIIQLNQCHTPEVEEEKIRIESNGGVIKSDVWADRGPKRICYKNNETKKHSGLTVSRSLGDFYSEQLGVISIPEVKEYDVDYNDIKMIVIATDGIWEFLTNEKVRDIILPYYEENNISGGINKLIKVGNKIWSVKNPHYIDDLSAIIMFFKY